MAHAHDPTRRVRVEETEYREPVAHEMPAHAAPSPVTVFVNLVYVLFGLLEVLLVLRFLLKLGNANTGNQLVAALYGITDPLVAPFFNIFPAPTGAPLIEVAALLAIAFLVLVEALIIALARAVSRA